MPSQRQRRTGYGCLCLTGYWLPLTPPPPPHCLEGDVGWGMVVSMAHWSPPPPPRPPTHPRFRLSLLCTPPIAHHTGGIHGQVYEKVGSGERHQDIKWSTRALICAANGHARAVRRGSGRGGRSWVSQLQPFLIRRKPSNYTRT